LNRTDTGKPYSNLVEWLRYCCAFLLYMYGVSKLMHLQFNLAAQLGERPVGSLTGYELTWFYFGYSRAYACILGLVQIAGATLLLFRKTTLMAAIILLPVMTNILLINMFILVNDWGPYVISALITAAMAAILWQERAGQVALLWTGQNGEPEGSKRMHWRIRIAIVVAVGAITISGVIIRHLVKHY